MVAANAVFNTYELLENILLHLPVGDILLAERVSRTSKSLIAQSQKISQALFRVPYVPYRVSSDYHFEFTGYSVENAKMHVPIFNPLANRILAYEKDISHGIASIIHEGFVVPRHHETNAASLASYQKFMRPDASWAKMFMTQPPISELHFPSRSSSSCSGLPYTVHVGGDALDDLVQRSEEGLKLGELRRKLALHWRACPEHPSAWYSWRLDHCSKHSRWRYRGECDVALVDRKITGWEILARMDEEAATWKVRNETIDEE